MLSLSNKYKFFRGRKELFFFFRKKRSAFLNPTKQAAATFFGQESRGWGAGKKVEGEKKTEDRDDGGGRDSGRERRTATAGMKVARKTFSPPSSVGTALLCAVGKHRGPKCLFPKKIFPPPPPQAMKCREEDVEVGSPKVPGGKTRWWCFLRTSAVFTLHYSPLYFALPWERLFTQVDEENFMGKQIRKKGEKKVSFAQEESLAEIARKEKGGREEGSRRGSWWVSTFLIWQFPKGKRGERERRDFPICLSQICQARGCSSETEEGREFVLPAEWKW